MSYPAPLRPGFGLPCSVNPCVRLPSQGRACSILLLDLGNNSISSEGAESLAALLAVKPDLTDLTMYMNDLGDEGVKKVRRSRRCRAHRHLGTVFSLCAAP